MRVNINSDGLDAELTSRILDRFDQDGEGHWIWKSSRNDAGLPIITVSRGPGVKGSKTLQVRRVLFEYLRAQTKLARNERVVLTCDKELCVAPLHMRVMTSAQILEMGRAARWPGGKR